MKQKGISCGHDILTLHRLIQVTYLNTVDEDTPVGLKCFFLEIGKEETNV